MRLAWLPALLLFASTGACAPPASPYYWVAGTADYSATSMTDRAKDESGAAPVRALYCVKKPDHSFWRLRLPLIRLAEGCVVDPEHTGNTCDLPTTRGPLRIVVKSASLSLTQVGRYYNTMPVNVIVGGETVDGARYVTYRFTGSTRLQDDTAGECNTLRDVADPDQARVAAKQRDGGLDEEDWSSWKNGKLCTSQGCAE